MGNPASVDAYLSELPDDRRVAAESLRQAIRAAAPHATETIAYQMPAYRSDGGQFLVSFASFKDHYSLYPSSDAVVAALGAELAPFLRGKGTISFPAGEPLPLDLVGRIVVIRVGENAVKGSARPFGSTSRRSARRP